MITLMVISEGYRVESDTSGFRETLEDLIDAAVVAKDEAKSEGTQIRLVPGCEGTFRLGTPENQPMAVYPYQIMIVGGQVHIQY